MRSGRKLFDSWLGAVVLVPLGIFILGTLGATASGWRASSMPPKSQVAPTPPMGWNSYDSYGGDVNEQEMKANARYLAQHLARYGWKYVVVDFYWYYDHPVPGGMRNEEETSNPVMDQYGRLLPAVNRFPSAANGRGFKPLADYVHSLGLKFGIHIMRGIPRAAVQKNLPVLGTNLRAAAIANTRNTCSWSTVMYGVDVNRPGGQAYYDSIVKLYADWGVDFIKADDMSSGTNPAGELYHAPEIEALEKAIWKSGRPIVLSLSPGPTPLPEAQNVSRFSQMWRISGDFWDNWKQVVQHFDLCRDWAPHVGANHWPDADMLPFGRVRIRGFKDGPRQSRLTHDEQITVMTLWSIFRSPLMMGGDLPSLDASTHSLLTNQDVIDVDQRSTANRELFRHGQQIAWAADALKRGAKYLALFNLADTPAPITAEWKGLGLSGGCVVQDLWQKKDLGRHNLRFTATIAAHGAGLYEITPAR